MPSAPLPALVEATLSAATKAGADAADVLAVTGTSVSIDVRAGKLEEATREEGTDVSLRVLLGTRAAVVSISDTSDAALTEMAERAVAMAREAPEDPSLGLADPGDLATDRDTSKLDLYDPADEPDPATLQAMAAETEAAALAVSGVTQSQGAGAAYTQQDGMIGATNGFSARTQRTATQLSCMHFAICHLQSATHTFCKLPMSTKSFLP